MTNAIVIYLFSLSQIVVFILMWYLLKILNETN
jgi:hypothetical protein